MTVYHGSKNGLEGPIRMVAGRNRQTCDFGQGFYMGDEPTQPRTLICDGERPTLYTLSLDLDGLKVHRFKTFVIIIAVRKFGSILPFHKIVVQFDGFGIQTVNFALLGNAP